MKDKANKLDEQAQKQQLLDENELNEVNGGVHTPRRPRDTGGIKEPWRGIIK